MLRGRERAAAFSLLLLFTASCHLLVREAYQAVDLIKEIYCRVQVVEGRIQEWPPMFLGGSPQQGINWSKHTVFIRVLVCVCGARA